MTFKLLPELPLVEKFVQTQMMGDEQDIFAEGEICAGTAKQFSGFVSRNGIEIAIVNLNSPGGRLVEGLLLGEAIRKLGFDTRVSTLSAQHQRWSGVADAKASPAICASACAYAFVGGRYRFHDAKNGERLGVHQFATEDDSETSSDAQIASGLIVAYLERMGVSPVGFSMATVASKDEMIWLSPEQASGLEWSNNGRLKAEVEVRVMDARPYLRLNQATKQGTIRILLLCRDARLSVLAGVFADFSRSMQMSVEGKEISYLVVNERRYFEGPMRAKGFSLESGGFFFERTITKAEWLRLNIAERIGVRFEVGRDFWYGNEIDLKDVRGPVLDFLNQC